METLVLSGLSAEQSWPVIMNLELISRYPANEAHPTPLLFVHGAFCGAWVWDEYFLPYFAEHGYAAHAISLRGHGNSEGRKQLLWTSLEDYVQDVEKTINRLGIRPILVGHSMGGVIVQKYLQNNVVPAAVLMASGPPLGMLSASIIMAMRNPLLYSQVCLVQIFGPRVGSAEIMRKAVFSDHVPAEDVAGFFSRMENESLRVAMDLAWPYVAELADPSPHLLVLGAAQDFFVSPVLVKATADVYETDAVVFPDMAHAMMLDAGWQHVADYILDWLTGLH